jgi:hypothetical protein
MGHMLIITIVFSPRVVMFNGSHVDNYHCVFMFDGSHVDNYHCVFS